MGGTLNLAILPTFGMRWLVPRLPDFARRHPDVTINMTTRLEKFNFDVESFDAAIHYGEMTWPEVDYLLLRHEQLLPVCAPSLSARDTPLSVRDIQALPLLHIQTRPRAWNDWSEAQGQSPQTLLPGTIYDQFSTITQAALHGLGVALMPDYLVEQELAQGRLVALHPAPTEAKGAYHLVWPKRKASDPALHAFRNWLATQAEPEDALPR